MAILTVSREFMSGGEEIAQAVAGELGYEYVDKDTILARIESAGHRWKKAGEELDESPPTFWERYDWQYRGFVYLVESNIYEYAVKNNVVIMGRGANVILDGIAHVLKVRFIAPLDLRIKAAMSKQNVDKETAEWLIATTDKRRANYVQSNFGKAWNDINRYDLVINTAIQSQEQAKQMISDALNDKDKLITDEVRKELEGRALAARIKAKVFSHPALHVPTLKVTFTGDAVLLKGVVSIKEHHLVQELAKEIAGAVPTKFDLHYRGNLI